MMPKILIGCPTSDYKSYCLQEYSDGLRKLTYKNSDILLVDNSESQDHYKKIQQLKIPVVRDTFFERARKRIVHSRNVLREKCLDADYEYFLSLEQDIIPPSDIIERMLQHKKKIVSGVYFAMQKSPQGDRLRPLLWMYEGEKMYYLNDDFVLQNNSLVKVSCAGLGCVLIHRDILKKIKFRFEDDKNAFDDVFFFRDVDVLGEEVYADLSIKCKHMVKNWSWRGITV